MEVFIHIVLCLSDSKKSKEAIFIFLTTFETLQIHPLVFVYTLCTLYMKKLQIVYRMESWGHQENLLTVHIPEIGRHENVYCEY